jgi:wyosine [tRNA(Phe)-imidazoG37] synthetase (radical SAM superfamily)
MTKTNTDNVFGPVPSRRLGRSLGINNIPPKICTYSCVYCQLGRTLKIQAERKEFHKPAELIHSIEIKIKELRERGEQIDYMTFVADGEPTLDINLGREIELLSKLNIKLAVITNSSLLYRKDTQDDLMKADWVSVKIDAASNEVWHRVNRPHRRFGIDEILNGITDFAKTFPGNLTTESMLIRDLNDSTGELRQMADFIKGLDPKTSYLSIPTRPTAETWAKPATEQKLAIAYSLFRENGIPVEYLIGYEGNAFAFTGNVEEDILSITAVHPMREDGIREYLSKAKAGWSQIEKLIHADKLVESEFNKKKFYVRKI